MQEFHTYLLMTANEEYIEISKHTGQININWAINMQDFVSWAVKRFLTK